MVLFECKIKNIHIYCIFLSSFNYCIPQRIYCTCKCFIKETGEIIIFHDSACFILTGRLHCIHKGKHQFGKHSVEIVIYIYWGYPTVYSLQFAHLWNIVISTPNYSSKIFSIYLNVSQNNICWH